MFRALKCQEHHLDASLQCPAKMIYRGILLSVIHGGDQKLLIIQGDPSCMPFSISRRTGASSLCARRAMFFSVLEREQMIAFLSGKMTRIFLDDVGRILKDRRAQSCS